MTRERSAPDDAAGEPGAGGNVSSPPRDLVTRVCRAIGLLPFDIGKRTLVTRYVTAMLERDESDRRVRVRRSGIEFELSLGERIDTWILLTGWWERKDMKATLGTLRDGDVVLDVGANSGLFALHAARSVGRTGRVYAFEPHPVTARRFARNVEINGLRTVHVRRLALGDRDGMARLYVPKRGASGGASLRESWRDAVDREVPWKAPADKQVLPVRVATLDRFCDREGLERIDFVKIDAEGAEPAVLKGGVRTLRRHRPGLMVECNRSALAAAGWPVGAFLALLWDLGYETRRIARFGSALHRVRSPNDVADELCNLHCRPRSPAGRA